MAGSPSAIWLLMGAASAVAFGTGVSFALRLRAFRLFQASAGRGGRSATSFIHEKILADPTGDARHVRIREYLGEAKVIVWLPGAIAIGDFVFVWFAVILYGYLLYIWFSILILVLVIARPIDAFEAFLISGRYLRHAPQVSNDDIHLISGVARTLMRASWFFVGLGLWFASFAAFDYLAGQALASWLTQATGSLDVFRWSVSVFILSVAATFIAAFLVWRPKDLDLEPAPAEGLSGSQEAFIGREMSLSPGGLESRPQWELDRLRIAVGLAPRATSRRGR